MYSSNGIQHTINWTGDERGISPFNMASVFDSGYTKAFLEKRNADSAIVYPYGLNLFTSLTKAFDDIKKSILIEIDTISKTLPTINSNDMSNDIRNVLKDKAYSEPQKTYIEQCYQISDEENDKRSKIEVQLNELNETNYDDKITIAKSEKSQFDSLLTFLQNTLKSISELNENIDKLYKEIKIARKANDESKAKIKILNEIGNTDSEEWKQFVKAGYAYVNTSGLAKEVCPYCRQPLSANSLDILAAYGAYISDKSETRMAELLKTKNSLLHDTKALKVSYEISEQLDKLLDSISATSPLIKQKVKDATACLAAIKSNLIASFEKEEPNGTLNVESIEAAIKEISDISECRQNQINDYKVNKEQKSKLISELKAEITPLIEHKAISEQKDLFNDWFEKVHTIMKLNKNTEELSTTGISVLAKRASQSLISENLKNKFQEELNALKLGHLQVDLSDDKASRGQLQMSIHLANNTGVQNILSEGEQKGIALALFIAERRMQLANTPIVLDDPVNSLDHHITAYFIERLTMLKNQIIIFSHNVLLQSTLLNLNCIHECGVNQRHSCNKHNIHLYAYKVFSQGRNQKGIIDELKQDNAANNLTKAERALSKIPFSETDTVSACLRRAIEMLIDEKVFNRLVPLKYTGKKDSIHWDELKRVHADATMIETLKEIYNRLSGGELHSGVEHEDNPIEYDELKDMLDKLKGILQK